MERHKENKKKANEKHQRNAITAISNTTFRIAKDNTMEV